MSNILDSTHQGLAVRLAKQVLFRAVERMNKHRTKRFETPLDPYDFKVVAVYALEPYAMVAVKHVSDDRDFPGFAKACPTDTYLWSRGVVIATFRAVRLASSIL